jgi:hypothetical protein
MKLIKALSALIVVLMIASVTLTNRNVDESLVVSDLTDSITSLQNQNTILRAQVATAGSLSTLSTKIAEAGFVESPKVVALPTPASVASR